MQFTCDILRECGPPQLRVVGSPKHVSHYPPYEKQMMMQSNVTIGKLLLLCLIPICILPAGSQSTMERSGSVHGRVTDPSGAIVPGASVVVISPADQSDVIATSNSMGTYQVRGLAPGKYNITVESAGFAFFTAMGVQVHPGESAQVDAALSVESDQEEAQVDAEAPTIDTTPDSNANAIVVKAKDLHALADDPDELANQLQALAGPSAGPNGAELYVDGFSAGQIPPKAAIREIRINQNPFSAQYDRLGYGRIEIFTKAGSNRLHGNVLLRGNSSGLNSQNPLLNGNLPKGSKLLTEPGYFSYYLDGSIGGPVTRASSFFTDIFDRSVQNVKVVDAIDPASITRTSPSGTPANQTVSNPRSRIDASARFDLQLGQASTLSLRYSFYRNSKRNQGVGQTSLPQQAYNVQTIENDLQGDLSAVVSTNFVNKCGFQYRGIRNSQITQNTAPTVTVSGAFISGGNSIGTVHDNQDDFELQDSLFGSEGNHQIAVGGRLRVYRDSNYSNSGTNGAYVFQSTSAYLNRTPQQYQVTVVNNGQYTARSTVYDAAMFFQDDWNVTPKFTFSYGTRWETQNTISDRSDWAPRVYFAYVLDHAHGKPKTVLRAGYGWFYERFTVPNSFGSTGGTPYVAQTIHYNLPSTSSIASNQQIFIENNPAYTETSPGNAIKPPNPTASAAATAYYSIAPNFRSALDMQLSVGVDRRISKRVTTSINYLYSRGVHQYLTNNINAPYFPSASDEYPTAPLIAPATNIYQFQSGGVYRQDQFIVSANARRHGFRLFSTYTLNSAQGDTSGVNHFPSNAHNPAADYGRVPFDIKSRLVVSADIQAPYQIAISPFVVFNSGVPYNIKIGSDLTGNNQFNARPTLSSATNSCASPLVAYKTYCFNPTPVGTTEKIIPYGFGTGPSNFSVNLRISKVIAFGGSVAPKGAAAEKSSIQSSSDDGRRYRLSFSAYAVNLFNRENLGTPNATVNSPFFGKFQALATGAFASPTAGNRSVFLQTSFSF